MLSLQVPGSSRKALRILCVGAHCDDIDIGCGATLMKLSSQRRADITWVALSGAGERGRELRASAGRFLRKARRRLVVTHEFRDAYFPSQYTAIKEAVQALRKLPEPDLIFTHYRGDLHQDHRLVSELIWNTFRNHLILEYEIPKYDGGLAPPNAFVEIDAREVERKIRILMSCYASQRSKPWFSPDTFRGIMRLRGIESGARSGWAEAFHLPKACIA